MIAYQITLEPSNNNRKCKSRHRVKVGYFGQKFFSVLYKQS